MSVSQGVITNKRKRGSSTRASKRNKGAGSPAVHEDVNIAPPHHFETASFAGAPSSLTAPPSFAVQAAPAGVAPVGAVGIGVPQAPPQGGPATGPANRMAYAISIVEETEGLSDEDFVKAVQLFRRRTEVTEAYLAIQSKRARSLYLKAEMADSLFEGDDH